MENFVMALSEINSEILKFMRGVRLPGLMTVLRGLMTLRHSLIKAVIPSLIMGLIAISAQAQNTSMNPNTLKACLELQRAIENMPPELGFRWRNVQVPLRYEDNSSSDITLTPSASETINVMYWTREARDPSYPPLVLVRGGVGANSKAMLDWSLTREYPGKVISLDVRGDGCSNYFLYNQHYSAFSSVTIEATLRDIEQILAMEAPGQRARFFGQSRGSALVQAALAKMPHLMESAYVHGLAMQSPEGFRLYSFTRSQFNVEVGNEFLRRHPEAERALKSLKAWLFKTQACFAVDYAFGELAASKRPLVCGPEVLDVFAGRMGAVENWQTFAKVLTDLVDPKTQEVSSSKARALLQTSLDTSLYIRYMGYIFGTNSQELGAPSPEALELVARDPELSRALVSEGRFIYRVAYPLYQRLHGAVGKLPSIHFSFEQVKQNLTLRLQNGDPLQVHLFASEFDAVARPRAFEHSLNQWGSLVNFSVVPESGHNAWSISEKIKKTLMRGPDENLPPSNGGSCPTVHSS